MAERPHCVVTESYSTEGGDSAHRTDNNPTPGPIPTTPHIYPANPYNLHIPGHYGQLSMANQPIPHIFGVWEENGAPGGNPRKYGKTVQAGNRTGVPGVVKKQC